jgi:hypothetical protein
VRCAARAERLRVGLTPQLEGARVDMFNEALGLYKQKKYDEVSGGCH